MEYYGRYKDSRIEWIGKIECEKPDPNLGCDMGIDVAG
jgi:hypothetical protein